MMSDEMDSRLYVGYREHAAAFQSTAAEISRLRERQATTEATLLHEVNAVRADVNEIKNLILRPTVAAPAIDHSALAAQRAMDMLERRGGGNPIVTVFALIGAVAMGALAVLMLT